MSEYYEPPQNEDNGKDPGQTTFILGLLSLLAVLVLEGFGIVGFVLGIISVVKGGRLKNEGVKTSLLSAGYVLGLIGLILSSIKLAILVFGIGIAFTVPFMFLF